MLWICSAAASCGPAPGILDNGDMAVSEGDGESFGSLIKYFCDDGYTLIGEPTNFCDSHGWQGQAPTCQGTDTAVISPFYLFLFLLETF